jgi:tetratricopeptide (TPR) repeat protein
MGRGTPVRVGEFSLSVDLGEDGKRMRIATLAEARVEQRGKRVTMRRSGFTPRADFQLEAKLRRERPPLTVARFDNPGEGADYVMARYTPDLDWSTVKAPRGEVVVVVDTSAAGDEGARRLRTATAEAVLRALSADDRFALVSLDVRPKLLFPDKGLSPAKDTAIAQALEQLSEHTAGGATDLGSMFDVALGLVHDGEQPAVVYVGDGVATSGEMSGEQLVERLRRALSTSRARLFTVAVGADADRPLLGELARAGGGQSLAVGHAGEATSRAMELAAAIKRPTITDLHIDLGAGLDEPFISSSGKVSRGSEVVVLARTHHDIPSKVKVRGRVAGEAFERELDAKRDKSVVTAFVPRLWAAEYVRRLLGGAAGPEVERGRIAALGIEYGLMTPFTSILALESEWAYRNMGIQRRRSPLRGVRLGALDLRAERNVISALHSSPPTTAFGCELMTLSGQSEPPPHDGVPSKNAPATTPVAAAPVATSAPADPASIDGDDEALPADAEPVDMPVPGKGGGGLGKADQNAGRELMKSGLEDARGGEKAKDGLLARKSNRGGWSPVALGTCSDSAQLPLGRRVILWRKRLRHAKRASELLAIYRASARVCELSDWQAERIFLELLQQRIESEGDAVALLEALAPRREVQRFVAKLMLRRAVDARLQAAVQRTVFGSAVEWNQVDLELSALASDDERLELLRQKLALAPADPNGEIRLVELLARAGRGEEALRHGRRLRDRGFMTLPVARKLGDVLARSGLEEEAVRTYSEIVEFDPRSSASRQLLGDIYLGRGWYAPAYRQYKVITERGPNQPLAWMRLAAAAAGAGRVDEALRLERQVATAQGRPGPDDPRRWARLMSAARLARLIHSPPPEAKGAVESIKRKLKELQLFRGPSTLVVLTWEDLTSDVELGQHQDDQAVALGELTDAAAIGLSAVLLSPADYQRLAFRAHLRSVPRDDTVALTRHDIRWDGKAFAIDVKRHEMKARETRVEL